MLKIKALLYLTLGLNYRHRSIADSVNGDAFSKWEALNFEPPRLYGIETLESIPPFRLAAAV